MTCSSSANVFAAVTSLVNTLISGWPIVAPSFAITLSNELRETTLNRCTEIWITGMRSSPEKDLCLRVRLQIAYNFRQEPCPSFRLVDPDLNHARGCDIVVL